MDKKNYSHDLVYEIIEYFYIIPLTLTKEVIKFQKLACIIFLDITPRLSIGLSKIKKEIYNERR